MSDGLPSDPQLAAVLEQNKARRRRAITIFVAVALVLGVGLTASALYFAKQAKRKRDVAYSRVVKCLFGKPLEAGGPPMTRVRAAWRAHALGGAQYVARVDAAGGISPTAFKP